MGGSPQPTAFGRHRGALPTSQPLSVNRWSIRYRRRKEDVWNIYVYIFERNLEEGTRDRRVAETAAQPSFLPLPPTIHAPPPGTGRGRGGAAHGPMSQAPPLPRRGWTDVQSGARRGWTDVQSGASSLPPVIFLVLVQLCLAWLTAVWRRGGGVDCGGSGFPGASGTR